MTCRRRFIALSIIMTQIEVKSILKESADILGEKHCLLGKDFQNQFVKDTEAKTKMHNAVRRKKKVLRLNRKLQRHPKGPFKRVLHVNKDTEVKVEGTELPTNLLIKK